MGRIARIAAALVGLAGTCAAGEKVVVGAFVNDIQALDLRTHSFAGDVYVWFRWKDEALDPSKTIGFVNAAELWGHSKEYDNLDEAGEPTPKVLPDGQRYQVLREQGRFSKKMILTAYPFDRQVLTIELEDKAREIDALEFVADEHAILVNKELIIPGFEIGEPRLVVETYEYPTSFGEPGQAPAKFSRVRIEIPIRRPVVTHGIKFLVPILCVVLCAGLMFLFSPKHVESRAGIGITCLLTIVALQITLNEDLPEIDYLVLVDKVYLTAYLFVIAGLAVVVRSSWLIDRSEETRAIRIDRISLASLGLGFFVITLLLIVPNLLG